MTRCLISVILMLVVPAYATEASENDVDAARAVGRAFLTALYQNDGESASAFVIDASELGQFVGKRSLNDETKKQVRADFEKLEIELTKDYSTIIESNSVSLLPVGSPLRFTFAYRGRPMVLSMMKTQHGWKVDLRWWSAMIRLAEDQELSEQDPEVVIKRYLFELMKHNTEELARLLPEDYPINQLYPEKYTPPFEDQYYYLVMEMPLVELSRSEHLLAPDASLQAVLKPESRDRFFLGIYWDTEMRFRLHKVGDSFRVEPGDHLKRMGL